MWRTGPKLAITLWAILGVPVSLACSYCIKDIVSSAEFDRTGWEASDNVYVGLVTKAELSFPENSMPRIDYSVRVEEVFKGNPGTAAVIYSQRFIRSWNAELREIGCGDVEILVGDRLLIFSKLGEAVAIGRCSASRLVEESGAGLAESTAATLDRLRSWGNAAR